MAQRLVDVKSVSHDGNDIENADSVDIQENMTGLYLGPSDDQVWPDHLLGRNPRVAATLNYSGSATVEDAGVVLGASGTLTGKGADPEGTVANDVTFTIVNAMILGKGQRYATQTGATFALRFEAESADGTTNPVSYS